MKKEDYLKLLLEEILLTAKNSDDFKEQVIRECHATEHGGADYTVTVARLLELHQTYGFFDDRANDIQQLVDYIKNADSEQPEEPIVFVPYTEDRDLDSLVQASARVHMPRGVLSIDYDTTTKECPVYALDQNDKIYQTSAFVGEAYAWENPVWVVSQEENVTTGEEQGKIEGNNLRVNGYQEFGGNIQVTRMDKLEPWISGKFEFRYVVFAQGGLQIKTRKFEPIKRKYLENSKWCWLEDFLCYWNTSTIGNYMVEEWSEMDGGSNQTVSHNIPAPCTGCPSTSFSYSIQKQDDMMDYSIVQFSDPDSKIYNISYSNFRRISRP